MTDKYRKSSKNIYKTEANKYRVRIYRNGSRLSKNFSKRKEAVKFRDETISPVV
jgi:hypothetical protein